MYGGANPQINVGCSLNFTESSLFVFSHIFLKLRWLRSVQCRSVSSVSVQPRVGYTQGKLQSAPHAPIGVALFMSAHSKTPLLPLVWIFSSGKGLVRGRRGQQLEFALIATEWGGMVEGPECTIWLRRLSSRAPVSMVWYGPLSSTDQKVHNTCKPYQRKTK